MKKFLAMALAAVMVLALAACGSKNDTADDTGDAQDAQGGETQKLIVGFDAEFPPFGFIAADGTYDGFDLAMAKELCARLGWEYEAVAIDWNSKDAELSSGTINCIWNGFTIREDLKESIDFSNAYCKNMQVAVIKAENSGKYTDLASLAKANIVAEAGSSGESAVADCEELKECNYVGVSKMADALLEVKAGTADAAVVDYVMAKAMVGEGTDYSDLQIVDGIELAYEEYGIGFRKDSNLVESVNKAMDEMIADGSLKAIADKYGLALMAD